MGLGAITLFWIQIEDVDIWCVVGLAALWSGWSAVVIRRGKNLGGIWQGVGWGGAAGLAVTPLALTLAAVKGGMHGHGFSDLTAIQIRQLVGLSGWWVAAGLILGGVLGRFSSEDR